MKFSRSIALRGIASLGAALATTPAARSADRVADFISGAKGEKELVIIAGAETFGGAPAMSALNDAFNKRFSLNATISLTPGPSMITSGVRLGTEYKANRTASSGVYLGPPSAFLTLDHDGVLERVDWTRFFPWITREMVMSPTGCGVLVRTGPNAIVYNPKFLAPDKAPKRYEDLVDPRLSPSWGRRMAMPPYPDWLASLTQVWGIPKVREFVTKLVAQAGGQLRYGEIEPLIDGQFSMTANEGSALEVKWLWQEKGVTLNTVFGSEPIVCDYFQLGVPKNSAAPNLAKLFVAFMASREAQAITDKMGAQGSHLVPGTRVYNFARQKNVKLIEPRKMYVFYADPNTAALYEELGKMLRP